MTRRTESFDRSPNLRSSPLGNGLQAAISGADYRADVDGLRAIAVLLVIGFHAFPNQVRGGFVGVDVFFVISGFLITRIITDDLSGGQFSFADFYARRARRLFPALLTMLAVCLTAAFVLFFPSDFKALGKHTLASALFVQNLVLLHEVNYFDSASELKPLLHMWSLAVEEQFYLLWPLTLFVASRLRFPFVWLASGVLLASFVANILLVQTSPVAAFYLPTTRFWELMAGSILAVSPRLLSRTSSEAYRDVAALAGVCLLAAAALVIRKGSDFPGAWALLPVGGTALLIAAGPSSRVARVVLAQRALVQIGLISYPLYLWHWPILAFARNLQFNEPTSLEKIAYIAIAFALAYATWRWIERPLRTGFVRLKAVKVSAALMAAAVVGLLVFVTDGMPARFPPNLSRLERDRTAEITTSLRLGACFIHGEDSLTRFAELCDGERPSAERRVALWGDSYAASLYPGLRALRDERPAVEVMQYTVSGCPPILRFRNERRSCEATSDAVIERLKSLRPDAVVLAARWELYDGTGGWGAAEDRAIGETITALKGIGSRIVVVGQFPVWTADAPKILARHYRSHRIRQEPREKRYLNKKVYPTDDRIKTLAAASGASFVSPLATFCNETGCLLSVPSSKGEPTAWDDGHMTILASEYFAKANRHHLMGE